MVNYWEPGTQYNLGDVVQYEGHKYKIIQSHRSQSDWTPPVTPALWGRLGDDDGGYQHQETHYQEQHQQQPYQQQPYQNAPEPAQEPHQQDGSDHKVSHEEKKKHWYDLDDNRKQQLEVGGGLLAGVGLLAGGYALYKEHEKSQEDKKAETWALSNWSNEAKARTERYRRGELTGPANWIWNEGTQIPQNAIEVGKEHDWTLYICRAFYDGGIQIGKASNVFQKGAVIGFKQEEIQLGAYEILVGDMRGLRWVTAQGKLKVSSLGYKPVEGGYENDGTPLYIAKAPHKGAVHPGKASEKLDGAYIPYGGTEQNVKEYQVLCYY